MIFDAILTPVLSIINKFVPDTAARDAAKAEITEKLVDILAEEEKAQAAINQAEAGSSSLFVAGWRPFIGWCCGVAIAYQYIIVPFATWGFAAAKIPISPLPVLDNNLWQLITAMLGLGGLRTIEKFGGVAK